MSGKESFDFATAFQAISVVFGVLTVAITVVASYVGYLAIGLPKRIQKEVREELLKVNLLIEVRIQVLNSIVEAIYASTGGETKAREMAYLLTHIMRLGAKDQAEVEKSLLALEGFGHVALPFLPLAERMRAVSSWNAGNTQIFNNLLTKLQSLKSNKP